MAAPSLSGPATTGLALAPNGDAVLAGAGGGDNAPDLSHARITASGAPAPGYGTEPVRTFFPPYHHTTVGAVATDAAGHVVVGGGVRNRGSADYPAYAFARYLAGGRPDPSFGTDGVVILELQETPEQVRDLAVDRSGRIVFVNQSGSDGVVGRLTPDGRLDTTFAGGWVKLGPVIGDLTSAAYAVAVLPDGGVVVVGENVRRPFVVRLTVDGQPDPRFGDGGVVQLDDSGPSWPDVSVHNVAPAPGGRFVLAGASHASDEYESRLWAIRLAANGSVDPTFGGPTGTSVRVPIPPRTEAQPSHLPAAARDVGVQADGKVVLARLFTQDGVGHREAHGVLARLRPDGTPDPGFGGGDGVAVVRDGWYGFTDVAIQRDGRILAATVRPSTSFASRAAGRRTGLPRAIGDRRRHTPRSTRSASSSTVGAGRGFASRAPRGAASSLRIGRKVVAKTRATHVRRVTVRLPRRIVHRLERRGELAARLEIRFGGRRLVRQVVLSPPRTGAP